MLLRFAIASLAGLAACAEEDSISNPSSPGEVVAPVEEGSGGDPSSPGEAVAPVEEDGLRMTADLSGSFAERFRIVGEGIDVSGPGQVISLTFEVDGADRLRQFDMRLKVEPASAFDLENAAGSVETPFVTPVPNGVKVEGAELRFLGASLTDSVTGTHALGTLRLRTASEYDPSAEVRLVLTSLSLGPNTQERDEYDSDLGVGVSLND